MQDRALNAPQQPTTSPTGHNPAREDWLLSVAADVERARADWTEHGVALFRCGPQFTAVRIPAGIVHAAAGTTTPDDVAADLAALGGPVFFHPRGQHFYALTSPEARWREPDTEVLSPGTYIGIPALDRMGPGEGLAAYWVVPLSGPGALCDAHAVARVVCAGRDALVKAAADGGPTDG